MSPLDILDAVLTMGPVLVAGALGLALFGGLIAWPIVLFITSLGCDPIKHETLW